MMSIPMVKIMGGTFKFELGTYPVTQAQWQKVMGSNPSVFKGFDQCPVESVSWYDVQEFLQKLNAQTNGGYRLPTEAEWEYAARGGNKSQGRDNYYAGSDNIDEVAWYWSNFGNKTHPVGLLKPNELGIYDLSGNVWEWCYDWYSDYPSTSQSNPKEPDSGIYRVARGGSWNNFPKHCNLAYRNYYFPNYRYYDIGFRLARDGSK